MSFVGKEYGLADSRWAHADPTIVALEILTVFFCSPLCVMMIYGIAKRRWWRHFVQIVVNVCELYGGGYVCLSVCVCACTCDLYGGVCVCVCVYLVP